MKRGRRRVFIAATPGLSGLVRLVWKGRYHASEERNWDYTVAFATLIVSRRGRICCIVFIVRFPWLSISAGLSLPVRSHQPLEV
jgi:hypothetical protein